ncbi:hypothetical protein VUR80DRAFT_9295 [Thermomyces stellatus]
MEPPPPTAFPSAANPSRATKTHAQANFRIATTKLPISKAGPIDAMSKALTIPVPEMIFGDNLVRIAHAPSGWAITFNAFDALDAVGKTAENMLQVAYAEEWARSREGVKDVVNPFDWSYSSTYDGTLEPGSRPFEKTDRTIPLELLKRRDPILFFDDVVLYESELDDNGVSVYSVKVRVHEKRMLLLARLFVRVDNVIVRLRDTRVYVDFETDQVTKEYTAREDSFANVKKALLVSGRLPDDVTIALRDPNILSPLIPIVESRLEGVDLKS